MVVHITPERELLKDRSIIVTGAASGLGRATAYVVGYQGANVALVDLNESQGQATVEAIRKDFPGQKITFHRCDITDESAVAALFADVVEQHGALHGLGHCAGMFGPGKEISDVELSAFEREMKVNTIGTFLMNKYAVRQFKKQNAEGLKLPVGGWSIVNVGSKASTAGNREALAYTASKHAVLGISRTVAVEQAVNHVRCTCVCPGPVDTPLTRTGANIPPDATIDEMNQRLVDLGILNQILLKKMGQPEDVAHQVTYLLGPRAQFMTKSLYEVDGGWI